MNAAIGWVPGLRLNLLRFKNDPPQSANPGGVGEAETPMTERKAERADRQGPVDPEAATLKRIRRGLRLPDDDKELEQQLRRHQKVYMPAVESLQRLTNEELASVVVNEIDRRGKPPTAAGLVDAARIVIQGLLTELDEADKVKARRLSAVARGVQLRSETQDVAPKLRQLSDIIIRSVVGSRRIQLRTDIILSLLEWEMGIASTPELGAAVIKLLSRRSHAGRVADIALAARILVSSTDRRTADIRVREALKQI